MLALLGACSGGGQGAGGPGGDGGAGGNDGATGGDAGAAACTSYTPMTIAAMRTPATPGCYELANVALVARTSSATTPRLYVQDPQGGDYSAVMAKCSATAVHPCPASALATALQVLDGESVTLRGYYEHGKVSGFEEFSIESITDNGATLTIPPPVTLAEADLGRNARVPTKWFQKAKVNVTKLVMYDFSPAEMQLTGPCPAWEGFAMISASAGATAATACNATTNPTGVSTPAAGEILVGRQFFHNFTYSTDCACAAAHHQILLTSANFVSGTATGILILETPKGSTTAYQVFEPLSKTDFPVQ